MKKILIIIIVYLINTMPVLAEKNDCSEMKKLSKEYLTCTAKNIKAAANKKNKQIKEGSAKKTEQITEGTKKITKNEGQIDWKSDALKIIGKINGLYPSPGAFFNFNGQRYKILKAEIGNGIGQNGEVISDNLEIACGGEKSIKVLEIQREGKKVQKIGEFMLGSQIKKGSIISNV